MRLEKDREPPAIAVEINKVIKDGTFLAINIPVTTGTISSQSEILKLSFNEAANSAICPDAFEVCVKPAMVKIINVITIDGIVVSIIYRIWENKGVCVTEEANTVVSESGEILSPK